MTDIQSRVLANFEEFIKTLSEKDLNCLLAECNDLDMYSSMRRAVNSQLDKREGLKYD